jgi:hypothetical protein
VKKSSLFILVISLVLGLSGCASSWTPATSEELEYSKVYSVEGSSKEELFKSTLAWVSQSFPNPKGIIASKDFKNGKIIVKPDFRFFYGPMSIYAAYSMTIDIKDGKVRAHYTNWTQINGETKEHLTPIANQAIALNMKQEITKVDSSYGAHIRKIDGNDW